MQSTAFHITWPDGDLIYQPTASRIRNHRTGAVNSISGRQNFSIMREASDFEPFCLTIFLSHLCNLACRYCYAASKEQVPLSIFRSESVLQIAEWIARNSAKRKKPFILGFHGGNEPLLFPELMNDVMSVCKSVAKNHNVELFPHCTTNGVLDQDTAIWARDHVRGITLSWDGPADIHDAHRMQKNSAPTSDIVQQTAHLLNGHVPQFRVRVTVTNSSVHRLSEIVDFFDQQRIRHVEFYPIYQDVNNSLDNSLIPESVEFVRNFLAARKSGRQRGMTIGFAASRIENYHHTFCPLFQENLTVTPDGFFTSCFLATHNENNASEQFMFGSLTDENEPQFDQISLQRLISKLSQFPQQCQSCFNQLHCAKGCPEICMLRPEEQSEFDCTIAKWIGLANIIEAAGIEITDNQLNNCKEFFEGITIREFSADESI